jgi:hypothetical protein
MMSVDDRCKPERGDEVDEEDVNQDRERLVEDVMSERGERQGRVDGEEEGEVGGPIEDEDK